MYHMYLYQGGFTVIEPWHACSVSIENLYLLCIMRQSSSPLQLALWGLPIEAGF